jgi:hypothetical protein
MGFARLNVTQKLWPLSNLQPSRLCQRGKSLRCLLIAYGGLQLRGKLEHRLN